MATELVNRIWAAEKDADALVARAKADAEKMIGAAQAEAAGMVGATEADGKRRTGEALEAARRSGREEAARLAVEAKAEAETVRRVAAKGFDKAVKLVMERIVNA